MLEVIDNEKVVDWYYLEPYNGRKSFYKKAVVYETEKYYYLQSYETLMCRYVKATGEIERLDDYESLTTTSHLGSFHCEMGVSWNKKKFYNQDKVELEEDKIDDEFVEQFKKDYDGLHPRVKAILAQSGVMVHSKEQAEDLMKMSKVFSLLFGLEDK